MLPNRTCLKCGLQILTLRWFCFGSFGIFRYVPKYMSLHIIKKQPFWSMIVRFTLFLNFRSPGLFAIFYKRNRHNFKVFWTFHWCFKGCPVWGANPGSFNFDYFLLSITLPLRLPIWDILVQCTSTYHPMLVRWTLKCSAHLHTCHLVLPIWSSKRQGYLPQLFIL
jgi:hypothetical protein